MNDEAKNEIVRRFMENVYGREPVVDGLDSSHDGRYGHWLETQMGIIHNGDNAPDLLGYEMKNDTTSGKTSFGDWSPNEKIFDRRTGIITREEFIKTFGHPSRGHEHRWSWSGEPVPKINQWNKYGQTLIVDENNNISVLYEYEHDERQNKQSLIPTIFQTGSHKLMTWTNDYMRKRVEDKFNQNGWFKCLRDDSGVYYEIAFGEPITFEQWIEFVKNGIAYLDSGMYHDDYDPNVRPYMQWRANNDYWDELIVDRYPK